MQFTVSLPPVMRSYVIVSALLLSADGAMADGHDCEIMKVDGVDAATSNATCLLAKIDALPLLKAISFLRPQEYGPTWSTYPGYRNFEYAKDIEGMVHLRGMMLGCASSDIPIFTLSEGYRPKYRLIFSTMGGRGNDPARVDVTMEGAVYFHWSPRTDPCPSAANNMWLTIEGISFEAEQ